MKIIEVIPTTYNIKCLYQEAKSKEQRSLLGYMLQMGHTDDGTLGGAFHLLGILSEMPKSETYTLKWESEELAMDIITVVEAAKAGVFKKFALSRREVCRIRNNICNIADND